MDSCERPPNSDSARIIRHYRGGPTLGLWFYSLEPRATPNNLHVTPFRTHNTAFLQQPVTNTAQLLKPVTELVQIGPNLR
jgi:hypothetical protein